MRRAKAGNPLRYHTNRASKRVFPTGVGYLLGFGLFGLGPGLVGPSHRPGGRRSVGGWGLDWLGSAHLDPALGAGERTQRGFCRYPSSSLELLAVPFSLCGFPRPPGTPAPRGFLLDSPHVSPPPQLGSCPARVRMAPGPRGRGWPGCWPRSLFWPGPDLGTLGWCGLGGGASSSARSLLRKLPLARAWRAYPRPQAPPLGKPSCSASGVLVGGWGSERAPAAAPKRCHLPRRAAFGLLAAPRS